MRTFDYLLPHSEVVPKTFHRGQDCLDEPRFFLLVKEEIFL